MSEALVFYNPRKGPCPIYIQDDVPLGLVKPTKDLIENFGGLVTEDPQKAIIIVIVDRNTHLGSKLITEYAGESSAKGVVDQIWTLESIRQGRMLGPPGWGGYALHRHTAQTYFDDMDENTSTVAHTASSPTADAREICTQSIGHTSLLSSESSGQLPTPTPTGPSVLHQSTVSERPLVLQQSPSRQSRTTAHQNPSAHPLPSTEAPLPQRTVSHVRDVGPEIGLQGVNATPDEAESANSTPQPPAEEDRLPLGKRGRFRFTGKWQF
ncbi:hypothetical protein FRC01_000104 [Tulasnella sp. 417]|nr:hypothetical protein FRC01_000104 [Tulasnella sp. 417]